jgi:hypothetical protein
MKTLDQYLDRVLAIVYNHWIVAVEATITSGQ